jgi:hypothetical protein
MATTKRSTKRAAKRTIEGSTQRRLPADVEQELSAVYGLVSTIQQFAAIGMKLLASRLPDVAADYSTEGSSEVPVELRTLSSATKALRSAVEARK